LRTFTAPFAGFKLLRSTATVYFLHFDEMGDFADHADDGGRLPEHPGVADAAQAEPANRLTLAIRGADLAASETNSNACILGIGDHLSVLLAELLEGLAALTREIFG
jgi:hypothetical protein